VRERELDIKAYDSETKRLQVTGANEAQIQAITRDLINQMLSQPDPLPGDEPVMDEHTARRNADAEQPEPEMPGDGPGADNTPMHEQAEAPAFEQSESTSEPDEMGEGMQQ